MKRMLTALIVFGAWLAAGAGDMKLDFDKSWIRAKAHATAHNFTVEPERFECAVHFDDDGELTGAEFSCSVADLKTGKKKRDNEMLHWLESELFPRMTFTMTDLQERDGLKIMTGEFSLHNVSQTLEIPVIIERLADGVRLSGHAEIETKEFGLDVIRKFGFLTVRSKVKVDFTLEGAVDGET